jgi:hypothetical protein
LIDITTDSLLQARDLKETAITEYYFPLAGSSTSVLRSFNLT